jgi:hypothetical protein
VTKVVSKRTVKTNAQIERAIELRAGGYSLQAISLKLNISISCLSRKFAALSVGKGQIDGAAVLKAQESLLNDAGFLDGLRSQIAASVVDDAAHCEALRLAAGLILEEILADTETLGIYKARALASLSTVLITTQKASRIAYKSDQEVIISEDLPTLHVSELTVDDIQQMRIAQLEISNMESPHGSSYDDQNIIESA